MAKKARVKNPCYELQRSSRICENDFPAVISGCRPQHIAVFEAGCTEGLIVQ